MSAYFELGRWIWIVRNYILFKMSFGCVIFDKIWESYACSKLSWLFLQNPNLATLSFDELWVILEESWSNLDQMMNNKSKWECWPKILKFDCMWATVDFWPNTVDFQAFEQLIEQTSSARLETLHGWYWEHNRKMVSIFDPLVSSILMKYETLIWGRLPLGESLSGQLLDFLEQFEDLTWHVLRNMGG